MDKTLKEIHDIRERMHEERNGLSPEEARERLHKEVEKIMKERNMHLRIISKETVSVH
ncbi:MAG: hypothetical protein M1501_03450 [Candidatus Omnitrophica bacterium]|nr:hypothetical protein [Candidatus Omnitrophota bacterium]